MTCLHLAFPVLSKSWDQSRGWISGVGSNSGETSDIGLLRSSLQIWCSECERECTAVPFCVPHIHHEERWMCGAKVMLRGERTRTRNYLFQVCRLYFFWTERHCWLLSSVINAPVKPKGNSSKLVGGGKILLRWSEDGVESQHSCSSSAKISNPPFHPCKSAQSGA